MVVGTVTTGAPGSFADIVNVGTPSAAILDFTIPRGDTGAQGPQGDPGQPGVVYASSPLSYDSGTQTISIDLSAYATQSYVTSQGYITSSALTPYLTSSTAASTYLAKSGGYITGDINSNNASSYRTWDGLLNTAVLKPDYLQFNRSGGGGGALTVEWDGITFPGGKQTIPYPGTSILNGYATEYWVTTQLGSYLTTSSAASTYQTISGMSSYLTTATAASTYYPLTNPSSFISDAPSDNVIYARFNGTWVNAGDATPSWGNIIGDISNQMDLQGALAAKYDASNPAGYISNADLSGYALLSGSVFTGRVEFANTDNSTSPINIASYLSSPLSLTNGDVWFDHNQGRMAYYYAGAGVRYVSNTTDLASYYPSNNPSGYITSSSLTPYALLAGATFTGKVNFTPVGGVAGVNVGVGGTSGSSTSNGDLWITTGGTNLNFRDGTGSWRILVNTSNTNTFSSPQIIDTTSNTLAGLRITQKGTMPALVVEDATNPDTTATVIDQNGNLGVGVDASTWTAANKVEIVGAVKAQSITFDGTAQFKVNSVTTHGTGANTHDLLISFNGSTYRVPMIFVSTP